MELTPDVEDTIQYIKSFWPQLHFEAKDILKGNLNFAVKFYSTFLAELNDKISYLINEENINDEFADVQNFDEKIVMYCRLSKIFKMVNMSGFSLMDLYYPNPKKTYPFLKLCIHLAIYINNHMDDVYNMVNEIFKVLVDIENLSEMKRQHLQSNAEIAEQIGIEDNMYANSVAKFEEVKKNYEKMLEEKNERRKIQRAKTAEMEQLKHEIENLEYEMKLLEEKEANLKMNVITEEEFESLKKTQNNLDMELQRLCSGADVNNEKNENNVLDDLEQCLKDLENMEFDSFEIEAIHEGSKQITVKENIQKNLENELNSLNDVISVNKSEVEKLEETYRNMLLCYEETKNKITCEVQSEAESYVKETNKSVANFEECQKVGTEINLMEENIRQLEENESFLTEAVTQEYKIILESNNITINNFFGALERMTQQ